METILYDERIGDSEYQPNTLRVTLTKWVPDLSTVGVDSHYLLTAKVTVGHKIVANEFQAIRASYINFNDDAENIRKAIAHFDKLLELHPFLKDIRDGEL